MELGSCASITIPQKNRYDEDYKMTYLKLISISIIEKLHAKKGNINNKK